MESVFIVQHLHILPEEVEDVKIIGICRNRESAIAAVERVRRQPGFCDFPSIVEEGEGFHITGYPLDKDHWSEGFVTLLPEDS